MKIVPEYRDGAWRVNQKHIFETEEQVDIYLKFEDSAVYNEGMHDTEMGLIKKHKDEIILIWPDELKVIDLGCGRSEKTIVKIVEGIKAGKNVEFHAVDMSNKMLSLTKENARNEGVSVITHNEMIEDFRNIIDKINGESIYYNLGANFSNFSLEFIDELAHKMKENDFLYISVQINNGKNEKEIMQTYSGKEIDDIFYRVMQKMSFKREDYTYVPLLVGDTVECTTIIKQVPKELVEMGVNLNDKIVLQNSRKPTLKGFKSILGKNFKSKIWTNDDCSYAIAVCKKK